MKYLYVLTPAVPRHDCHNDSIIPSLKFLGECGLFENIMWYVNIDNPTSNRFKFEDRDISLNNFKKADIGKVNLDINLPEHPCFYEAFSHLLNKMKKHIDDNNIKKEDYCFIWWEDDWVISKHEEITKDIQYFVDNDEIKFYTLYKNKLNMGGNPQFMKGELYEQYFRNLDLRNENKRDPEVIIRNEIFKDNIFDNYVFEAMELGDNVITNPNLTFKDKLIIANRKAETQIDTFIISNGMYGSTVEDIGDDWRDARGFTKWSTHQKEHGIKSTNNYTYN